MKIINLFLLLAVIALPAQAGWKWHNPQKAGYPVIQGQGWTDENAGSYRRLPLRAKEQVRPPLWDLSENSAGLSIHFYSTTPKVKVRYTVSGGHAMPHMPATGVSGLDLYVVDENGRWERAAGNFSFGDTLVYDFGAINPQVHHSKGYEYRLFLPLYNSVKWMEIGTSDEADFTFAPASKEKPIVVYGTSIAQGACASRPAMAWSNVLNRKMEHPLINLGFSGNGKLEKEMLSLLGELDARVYVLDCLPNISGGRFPVYDLVMAAIHQLRTARPQTPILLVEHAGFPNMGINVERKKETDEVNQASRQAYEALLAEGVKSLYYLSREEMSYPADGWVDVIHPSDWGMMAYATAYEKKLREILNEPVGTLSTTIPVMQRRDANTYEWLPRHESVLAHHAQTPPRAVVMGNSITHFWGGEDTGARQSGKESWEKTMKPAGFYNMGCGWDRIENLLWRVYHGELDGFAAKKIVLKIGTNNLDFNTDSEIVDGMKFLLSAIRLRQPQAVVKVMGILPRKGYEPRIKALNKKIERMSLSAGCRFTDAGSALLQKDGKINASFFSDGLHPNEQGYNQIAVKVAE
ncbi:MAG: SGNH/GDSL hydrolase family protein [Bacteroides sp.]